MIKAIITDVDGVIVGSKTGVNFPYPSDEVIQVLKQIRKNGIPVILCTAKVTYGITEIIKRSHLDNAHITNAGATIIDPLDNKILAKYTINQKFVKELVKQALEKNITIEIHTEDNFMVQKNQVNNFVKGHSEIMQKEPIVVDHLLEKVEKNDIIKVFMIASSEEEKSIVDTITKNLGKNITHVWSHHPTMLPVQFAIITAFGVSKKHAAKKVADNLGISFNDILGLGDTLGDWNYMQLCGYVGVTGNHSEEFKNLAKTKGEGKYFLANSVDENGVLDVFKYFKLI